VWCIFIISADAYLKSPPTAKNENLEVSYDEQAKSFMLLNKSALRQKETCTAAIPNRY